MALVFAQVALPAEFQNTLISDLLVEIHNLKRSGGLHHLKVIMDWVRHICGEGLPRISHTREDPVIRARMSARAMLVT